MTRSTRAIDRMSTRAKIVAGIATIGAASAGIFALGLGGDLTLTNFALSTNAVNVDSGDATVTCAITVTSTGTPVLDVGCTVFPPADGIPVSCTAHSGAGDVWSCDITILQDAEAGTWALSHLIIRDTALVTSTPTNADILAETDLCGGGQCVAGDLEIEVTSAANDTTGPNIDSFAVFPTDPDPGDPIACDFTINPNESGGDVSCTYDSTEPYLLSCTGHGGVETCNIDIPVGADAGVTWNEVNHVARDAIGNRTLVEGATSFLVGTAPGGCGGFVADYVATSGWGTTQAETPSTETLTVDFYAQPTVSNQNGLVAFAQNTPIDAFGNAAMIVRFGNAGIIEIYDGTGYGCKDITCPTYDPNVWYHFEFTANMTTDLYTAKYETCDDGFTTISTDAAFRDTAPHVSIGYHNAWSVDANEMRVDQVTWTPGACNPLTCLDDFPAENCGEPDDGCGTPLDCGTCTNDPPDVCVNFQCCTPGTVTSVCVDDEEPDFECGLASDGCGGTVDCDDVSGQTCDERVSGEICIAHECVDPGVALEPENAVGDSWETIYENCTDDAYDPGFRPPIFVRPTLQNTGVNCPDKASGCPADATLTPLGTSTITTPGLYENFTHTGRLNIEASNVTLRNFEVLCNETNGYGLEVHRDFTGALLEYGTIRLAPGADQCGWPLFPMAGETYIHHMHFDQCGQDCMQSTQVPGPVLVERSLFTRLGDNGGYGSGSHTETWQYYNNTLDQHACWLGSRTVPSYCPNFYKQSNITQSGWDPPATAKWYLYNNWFDASTNVMIAGDGAVISKIKFGNFTSTGRYWGSAVVTDHGGHTFECDGSPLTDGQSLSVQSTCPWGFDNDPVIGWDGVSECGNGEPCDGNSNPIACTGTVNSQPIDPTEFCVSDGSGCIVTPIP